jgi:antitoxin component YwqK of YwqJK toxin-antitoxin module
MKTSPFLLIFLALLISCVEEKPDRTDENLSRNLSMGVWEISFFDNNGTIQTEDFQGISFVFYPNGKSEAYRTTQLLDQGNWKTYVDSGKIKLELTFSDLKDLNGEWNQDFIRESQIKVKHESMNTILVFEKI